jgi:hypothetical protein
MILQDYKSHTLQELLSSVIKPVVTMTDVWHSCLAEETKSTTTDATSSHMIDWTQVHASWLVTTLTGIHGGQQGEQLHHQLLQTSVLMQECSKRLSQRSINARNTQRFPHVLHKNVDGERWDMFQDRHVGSEQEINSLDPRYMEHHTEVLSGQSDSMTWSMINSCSQLVTTENGLWQPSPLFSAGIAMGIDLFWNLQDTQLTIRLDGTEDLTAVLRILGSLLETTILMWFMELEVILPITIWFITTKEREYTSETLLLTLISHVWVQKQWRTNWVAHGHQERKSWSNIMLNAETIVKFLLEEARDFNSMSAISSVRICQTVSTLFGEMIDVTCLKPVVPDMVDLVCTSINWVIP